MNAICLLLVLLISKALLLSGQPGVFWGWGAIAYFSQDVLVAAIAWTIDRTLLRRAPRASTTLYAAAVLYVAVNVPVALVLGSPLTMPMLRATGGALSDSIVYYATWANIARVMVVVAAGAALPIAVRRGRPSGRPDAGEPEGSPLRVLMFLGIAAVLVLAPIASARVDTGGRDRNAFTALMPIALPAAAAASAVPDLRISPFPTGVSPGGLARYHASATSMNVLVVILESTAARYLKPYGARHDPTPNLTALSERALVFENAYAVYPESIKGLFATLCSRYPLFNEPAETQATMPCASIGTRLRDAGYRTGLFHSGRFAYLGMQAILNDRGFDALEDAGAIGGNIHSSFGVDEPAAVDRILGWVDAGSKDQPFFAVYLPIAGHHPYATPEAGPFGGDDVFSQYENALHYGDASVGALLAGLRSRHIDDRTMIIVLGDHGEAFGQHPGNVGHTLFIHDENMRVPYVISVPGATRTQVRVASAVSLIDTAPTILDFLGLPASSRHEGRSVLSPGSRMALFFTDYSMGWLGLRDGCWKYELETGSRRSKLFDVCRDDSETRDLSGGDPARVEAYRRRVEQWAGTLIRSGPTP